MKMDSDVKNTPRDLEEINFTRVLKYKMPVERKRSERNENGARKKLYSCDGFCYECEYNGWAPNPADYEVLMSHGCTSDDMAKIIGKPCPIERKPCPEPIMFLLENPGGVANDTGAERKCNGVTKYPPIKQFYFSSDLTEWPTQSSQIKNPYGDYFAYLMARHGLTNVYITNCIKCKYTGGDYGPTAKKCIETHLQKEIDIFKPKLIICFGVKAENLLWKYVLKNEDPMRRALKMRLLHPAARRSRIDIVGENDKRMQEALVSKNIKKTTCCGKHSPAR